MNNKVKYQQLDLINYEGGVLVACRIKNIFIILDQWKNIVELLNRKELKAFINGEFGITDSSSKTWMYPEAHQDARPTKEQLQKFIKNNE